MKIPNRNFYGIFVLLVIALLLLGCQHDEDELEDKLSQRTIIMFYPWSLNLKTFFEDNIDDFSDAIKEGILNDERVVVCLSSKPSEALLIEIAEENGICRRDTFAIISHPDFTDEAEFSKMLRMVGSHAPAHHYSMIAGGHGMAWLPPGMIPKQQVNKTLLNGQSATRWFGDFTEGNQIDITVMANGIKKAGMHMDYILFDDCYMSSVEVAYALRDVTDYLIGCPSEIMSFGFPYYYCAKYLVGYPNYENICKTFKDFYSGYHMPYGTVAVTDCHELDNLAYIVKQINTTCLKKDYDINEIQTMDGFSPSLFFDFGDTYSHLSTDSLLLNSLRQQLDKTVPYKACTENYYSAYSGCRKINHFSGLTTSAITDGDYMNAYRETEWNKATAPNFLK